MTKKKPRPGFGPDALGSWPKHSGPSPSSRRAGNQAASSRYREGKVPITLKKPIWEEEEQPND